MQSPPTLDTPVDEFGTHMPYYQRGRAWYIASLAAALANNDDQRQLAENAYYEAERLTGVFADEDDSELFRDFIAGALRQSREFLWPDGDDEGLDDADKVVYLVGRASEPEQS